MKKEEILNKVAREQITNNNQWDSFLKTCKASDIFVFIDGAYSNGDEIMAGAAIAYLTNEEWEANDPVEWSDWFDNGHYTNSNLGGIASEAFAFKISLKLLNSAFNQTKEYRELRNNKIYIFADNQEIVQETNLLLHGINIGQRRITQPISSMLKALEKVKYKNNIKVIRMSRNFPWMQKVHKLANDEKQAAR
ncbi:hypothetical protein [Mycoplasma sp. E35C]|uniref:hypothetical protein n=1 Tax=Mycoplasma sp. E35C TaxID=2801918 RepID=UPI001CA3A09E|nr:hypothetical protein [Mycoplasma sp. E35C]QZX49474.1 hypothetical protein JJE79_01875 [Mycoplasma sp. E35C]